MPTKLNLGYPQEIAVDTVYAMPVKITRGYTTAASLEANMTNATTGWTAVVVTGGEFQTSAPFIRCTTGSTSVRLIGT